MIKSTTRSLNLTLRGIIGFGMLFFLFFGVFSFATSKFQLQDWMEETYLKHKSKTVLKSMVNNISDNTDLHHNALQASRLNKLSALHDSINFIINDIAAKYGKDCVLTYDDTISLLLRTENFKNYLEWIREFDKSFRYQVDDSGFALACRKYLVCFESGFNNMTNISQENMDRCISDTEKMFVGAYAYYQSKNLI